MRLWSGNRFLAFESIINIILSVFWLGDRKASIHHHHHHHYQWRALAEYSRLHDLTPLCSPAHAAMPSWGQGCVVGGQVQRYITMSVWIDLSADRCQSALGDDWRPHAERAHENCDGTAWAMLPNRRSLLHIIRQVTGSWPVIHLTLSLVTWATYGMRSMRRRHHWSNASERPLDTVVTVHVPAPYIKIESIYTFQSLISVCRLMLERQILQSRAFTQVRLSSILLRIGLTTAKSMHDPR